MFDLLGSVSAGRFGLLGPQRSGDESWKEKGDEDTLL